ncbi:hypothetical protein [Salinigranum salinum]|uniref:hypothetical protein n=1 Tax=Salinigranum salinum TaxID=1364937 RepID=UPI0012604D4E|nr:hypothetical protein [Salinigranum salinum]
MTMQRRTVLASVGLAVAGTAGCLGGSAFASGPTASDVDRTVGDVATAAGLRVAVTDVRTAARVGRVYDCPCGEPVEKATVAGDGETVVLTRLAVENAADAPREFPARAVDGPGDVTLFARGDALPIARLGTSYAHPPLSFRHDGDDLPSYRQAMKDAGAFPDAAPAGTRAAGWLCNVAPDFDPAATVVEVVVGEATIRWRLG